jgi:serine protease Do
MQSGDVIVTFDGVEVKDTRALVRQVGNTEVGKTVRVVVYRDSGTKTLLVTLGRREDAEKTTPTETTGDQAAPGEEKVLGMTLTAPTDEMRQELGLPDDAKGLVVTDVDEAAEAFEKGLRAGDLITEAGQQKVTSVADLTARITEAKDAGRKSILLLIRRGGDPRFVALTVDSTE